MSRLEKIRQRILLGSSDSNLGFDEICGLLIALGFSQRIKGSHHIFYRDGIDEILNLQPVGSKAKPYQVRQVRNIILKYRLVTEDE